MGGNLLPLDNSQAGSPAASPHRKKDRNPGVWRSEMIFHWRDLSVPFILPALLIL
jgi:hypothetical protein